MQPEDNRHQAPIVVPPRQSTGVSFGARNDGQEQAANLTRQKIEAIYNQNEAERAQTTINAAEIEPITKPTIANTPTDSQENIPTQSTNLQYDNQQSVQENPYARTHSQHQQQISPTSWEKYHSAWQSYYQQYYERYYVSKVDETKKDLASKQAKSLERARAEVTPDEALYDLRSKLRHQVKNQATKVRKSRHFLPIVAALSVMVIFLFLQYNRVIFSNVAAYISPGDMDPSTLIIDPNANISVSSDPVLVIPKINVQVPIVWDAVASSQASLNAAMDNGVAWFNVPGANAKPGEKGNFVLSGHSSNDWLDGGNYKFIFARLEQLAIGDTIYVNYNSQRYTYKITEREVVKPTDVNALMGRSDKPHITLITCVPLGTALNRLLVFAEQVSPDPSAAVTPTETSTATEAVNMPSNSPTFLQRVFGN